MRESHDFPIEFKTDITNTDLDLYIMIEDYMNKLAKGHTDITGASATLEQSVQGRETSHLFEATVVIYVRPRNISATEKREDPRLALKGALDAVGRQLRDMREQLR